MLSEVTGCDVEFAGDASPDPRSYRVDFSALECAFPNLMLDWDAQKVRRSSSTLTGQSASRRRTSKVAHTCACASCAICSNSTGSTTSCAGFGASVRFVETEIPGVVVVELEEHVDERGSFARTWCRDEMAEAGLASDLAQCSVSETAAPAPLRGLHFQRPPHEEAKLVRCTRGAIFDVAVDLRPDSPTRGRWFGVELDPDSGRALYVPEGCAHGFQTLVDDTDVAYMISTPYAPEASGGVRWDDAAFRDRLAAGSGADHRGARPALAGLRAAGLVTLDRRRLRRR